LYADHTIRRLLYEDVHAPPPVLIDRAMDRLLLPETDLSSRHFLAGIIYSTCDMIRSLTADLAHASTLGFQVDPTGFQSIVLVTNILSTVASRPQNPTYPVFPIPELPPPAGGPNP